MKNETTLGRMSNALDLTYRERREIFDQNFIQDFRARLDVTGEKCLQPRAM